MKTENEYVNLLVNTFNKCKEEIIKNSEVLVINLPRKIVKFEIPDFAEMEGFKIYSISKEAYISGPYIHLSGVNVLFYIASLYLQLQGNKGNFYKYSSIIPESRMYERTRILKKASFIYKNVEDGFWYFPISCLKSTDKFVFDLPSTKSSEPLKGRKPK